MRTMLLIALVGAALSGCVASENPDFRDETPTGMGSAIGQTERGSSTFLRSDTPAGSTPAAGGGAAPAPDANAP